MTYHNILVSSFVSWIWAQESAALQGSVVIPVVCTCMQSIITSNTAKINSLTWVEEQTLDYHLEWPNQGTKYRVASACTLMNSAVRGL